MNKTTKLGVSALCGSLAAVSAANAGDLTVSGGVDMISGDVGITIDQALAFAKRHGKKYNIVYKSGLISTLLYRSFTICSNCTLIHSEIKTIKSFLPKNGYPEPLLDRIVSMFLNKLHLDKQQQQHQQANTNKPKCFQIILPFLGTSTKRLEKKIKYSLRQHLPDIKINLIYRAAT